MLYTVYTDGYGKVVCILRLIKFVVKLIDTETHYCHSCIDMQMKELIYVKMSAYEKQFVCIE